MRENGWKDPPFLMGKSPFLMGTSPFLMDKSQFLMGKSTISTGPFSSIFNSYVNLPEGIISIISYQLVMIVLVGIEIIVLRINDGGDES